VSKVAAIEKRDEMGRKNANVTSIKDSSKGQQARSKAKALFSSFGSRAFRSLAAGKKDRQLVSCRCRKRR